MFVVFTVPGRGTVVVGTIKRGIMKRNAEADLMGHDMDMKTVVSDVQVFKKSVQSAQAGDNVGALLRGVRLGKVQRGMVLSAARSIQFANHFSAQIYLLDRHEGGRKQPIISGYIQQLFCQTWNIACRLDLPTDRDMLMPGDHAQVYLTLLHKMVLTPGESFTIRENNINVATGMITSVLNNIEVPKTNLAKVQLKL